MEWTIGAFILGTLAVASVGWWSVGRYLARVLSGAEGGRGTAQQRRQPDQVQTQLRAPAGGWPSVNLTVYERWVVRDLADAWHYWCQLPDRDEDDNKRMVDAIHAARDVIALRAARRADPDVWRPAGPNPPPAGAKLAPPPNPPMPAAAADGFERAAAILRDPLAEFREAGFASDLVALLDSGRLSIAGVLDGPGSMRLAPAMPTSPPPFTPAPPAQDAAALSPFVEPPHLTSRELWLVTQAYLGAKEPSSPRSVGEWLSERKTVVEPHRREPICATRLISLALRATRVFGYPGQTPGAR